MQITPLFLISPYGSSGGLASGMIRQILMLLVAAAVFFLWKKGIIKKIPRIALDVVILIAGIGFIIAGFFDTSFIPFQLGFSLIAFSSFMAIKNNRKKEHSNNTQPYYPSYLAVMITLYFVLSTGLGILWDVLADGAVEPLYAFICAFFTFPLSALIVALYFLPYRIANKREHRQTRAIYILNIFAGWTVVIWFVALIWAHTVPSEHIHIHEVEAQSEAEKIREFKDLYDSGIISKEEFEEKKRQLLNL